jgi:DNA helicase TIP49 (TBP-interacting protein)
MNYTVDWNNEISVDGFVIISNKRKNEIQSFLKNYDDTIYISTSGDDEIEYDNGKELLEEISFEKISREDIYVIKQYFGEYNDLGLKFINDIKEIMD